MADKKAKKKKKKKASGQSPEFFNDQLGENPSQGRTEKRHTRDFREF